MLEYPYQYFSGANVVIDFNGAEVLECAGISYSLSNSKHPVYSYESVRFDAVLSGREIVEGRFVINYTKSNYVYDLLSAGSTSISPTDYNSFTIKVNYPGNDKDIIIKNCFLIGRAQTIEIDDQVILEEYSFIARTISKTN